VKESQSVAHLDYIPANMQRVRVSRDLMINPSELKDFMVKQDGEYVQCGEVIASSFLFGERRASLAPIDGYVGLVSRRLGNVYLRQPIPLGRSERVEIDVARELSIAPRDMKRVLRVKEGIGVMPGQPVAVSLGLSQQVVTSPLYGKVKSIAEGKVVIEPLQVKTELLAYLQGRVVRVLPRQGVVIQAWAEVVQGQYGIGGEQGGELLVAAEANEQLGENQVTENWRGKVVVAGRTADLALLRAATGVGTAALVIGYLPFITLSEYLGEMGTPGLTGNEDAGMTIILTERFSACTMQQETWQKLWSLRGRYASVNGTTHIRAGVIRPEIVVCEPTLPDRLPSVGEKRNLQIGDQVRVIRQPWRDQRGRIVELPMQRQRLETGSEVLVAVIELAQERVAVPVSNLVRVGKE
jgi:hypothetical protein